MPAKKVPAKKAPAKKAPAKKSATGKPPAKTTARKKPVAKKAPAAPPPVPAIPSGPVEGLDLARLICTYADDKKAESLVILDVRGISSITDFFVVASGLSLPHLRAVRNEVTDKLWENHSLKPHAMEGMPDSGWMVLDFGDVVLHIFLKEKRQTFALEDLWSDAGRIDWQ